MNPKDRLTGKTVKKNLVALGSAAVLTVYAAGYLRTRPAAQRFDVEAAERRPPVPTAGKTRAPGAAQPLVDPSSAGDQAGAGMAAGPSRVRPAPVPPSGASPLSKKVAVRQPSVMPASVAVTGSVHGTASTTAPGAPVSVASARATDSTTKQTAATPPATTPLPATDSSGSAGTGQASDSTTQPADKEPAPYRDGVYLGWGSSRHGDIQAEVEIKSGRIVSASISQCLTRYSCSWIAALPPQVVSRQSPEVDYVSGATQSTNAFYYAVVEALSKAR